VPLRADGFRHQGVQVSWLADRRPSPPSRGRFTSVAFPGRRLPAHSCATAPVSHRIPLVPWSLILALRLIRLWSASGSHLAW
jgi:hypothetical protein